ncbi:unnamed protein product, partial [marine sediment metagenome]
LVLDVGSLARIVKEAFHLARTGRPGPVLIDIPRDIFMEQTEFHYPSKVDLPGYKLTLQGTSASASHSDTPSPSYLPDTKTTK